MKKMILIPALLICTMAGSQVASDYYLPEGAVYNKDIPTPEQFTGHVPGEWHLTHDKLLYYMQRLAELSDRAVWEEYARSYEGRPLGHLIISSPDNIRNLENLREKHLQLCDPSVSSAADIHSMPLFVKLGYGVHGNESSAPNASALVAYHLIASQGQSIDELLSKTVILIDPSLNPDGMQRHSTWVNSTKSLNNNPDPNSWEFSETWPGGRTNHYWFDLNRDYILLQHPESKGRVEAFYRWRPDIVTDHHEMGADATFFFQPGVQSRNNPLTPADNQALTAEIGKYHEKYLNGIGSLYYTEESYDDFYVGKGSSYPDIHGSVGILFEQAGVKGHLRNTPGGQISFPFAIRNQFTVSLSTLVAGMNMREKLLENQRNFYKEALKLADRDPVRAYVFSEPDDSYRLGEFISILLAHRIRTYTLAKDISLNGITYRADASYIVPLRQCEYRFIRSLFEPVKEFTDSIFYDVSTWVLPMAFNIKYTAVTNLKDPGVLTGQEISGPPVREGRVVTDGEPYAYLFEWKEYLAPKALYKLQSAGIRARVATEKLVCDDGTLRKEFGTGTIMVPVNGQDVGKEDLRKIMEYVARTCRLNVYGTKTGLTISGIDLGSGRFSVLQKPVVLMFTGDGSNSGDAGEIWHMLDTRYEIPVTMITPQRFSNADLDNYNVIIVAGSPDLSQNAIEKLRVWNRSGGTIIGYKSGNNWLARNKLAEIEYNPAAGLRPKTGVFGNMEGDMQVHDIPGSLFETKLDLTHPLCYGYTSDRLPVFKSGSSAVVKDKNIYNNPVVYTGDPLLSGYCSKENIERIKGTAFASIHGNRIISFYDNTNFRAITYGTNRLFMNAIFFSTIMGR